MQIQNALFTSFKIRQDLIVDVICFMLAFLFTYAALSKLIDHEKFHLQLKQSPFITQFADVLFWALPVAELIVVFLLSFSQFRFNGLYASVFLLSLFTFYLGAMLKFSYYIPCSCGGVLSSLSWKQHIIFNGCFIILSVLATELIIGYKLETNKYI